MQDVLLSQLHISELGEDTEVRQLCVDFFKCYSEARLALLKLQRQGVRMQRRRGDRGEFGDPRENHGAEQRAARKGGQDGGAAGHSGGCRHQHRPNVRFYQSLTCTYLRPSGQET